MTSVSLLMERCSNCQTPLTENNTFFNGRKSGHRYNSCKKCFNEKKALKRKTDVLFAESARAIGRKNAAKKADRFRQIMTQVKSSPCSDCGGSFHPCQVDFDHLTQDTKSGIISRMRLKSEAEIFSEISKCDAVCANCHRDRTQSQVNAIPPSESQKHGASRHKSFTVHIEPVPPPGTKKKTCTKCGKEKPVTSFGKIRGRLRSECNWCKSLLARDWREKTKEKRRLDRRRRFEEVQNFINSLKHEKPCTDCNEEHPYWRLDFDHRDGTTKIAEISKMKSGLYSRQRILDEIAKCDLVCANCHRIRTWNRSHGVR